MKKAFSVFILSILFLQPALCQSILLPPPGLKFNGKYLTDRQLKKYQTPEITLSDIEKFQHGFPQAGLVSYYKLKKDNSFYKNKFFQIENDSAGRQWIHLFMDAREYAISHNELKNLLKPLSKHYFNDESFFEFTFIMNTSKPQEQLQFFCMYFEEPVRQTLFRILYRKGQILIDLPEFKNKKVTDKSKFPLGLYELGTEAKIRFQTGKDFYSVFFNEKEVIRQKLTEDFETSAKVYYQLGPYPDADKKFFCEMFITDLNTAP